MITKEKYHYVIDLDERGIFKAHVENPDGKIIFEINSEEDNGEVWLVRDGFIKHTSDINGLWQYLQESSLVPFNSKLIYMNNET